MSTLLNPTDLHPPSDVRSRASDPRDQMCSVLISKTCSDNENKNENCSRENLIIFQGNTLRLFIYHRTEALRQQGRGHDDTLSASNLVSTVKVVMEEQELAYSP